MEAETILLALRAYHRVKSIDVQDVNWLLPFNWAGINHCLIRLWHDSMNGSGQLPPCVVL